MNNSDFLSDAVALDLGKSGVKVAETLEIQGPEEEWRLINAADVATVRAYQGRRLGDPVVVGGEIHLDGLTEYRGPVFPPYTGWYYHRCVAVGRDSNDGLLYGVMGQNQTLDYYNVGDRPAFRVFNAAGQQTGSDIVISDDPYFYPQQWLFWDSVNSRFVGATRVGNNNRHTAYAGAADGSSFVRVGSRVDGSWGALTEMRTFLEDEVSSYVYSLHLSGGSFYFRKNEITAGINALTLVTSVFTFAGSTLLAQIANHGNSAFLFYSRAYESIGVMWRDSAQGMQFVLESESFGTVHVLPDVGGGAKQIFSFGNFVVPEEGEFLVAGVSDLPSGILTKPSGFAFPTNFSLLGAAETAKNKGILIGKVGTTIYHLEINLETKIITDVFSVSAPYEPVRFVKLLYASGTKEIWIVQPTTEANPTVQDGMFCLDTSSKSLQWYFGATEFSDTTLWGISPLYSRGTVCCRVGIDRVLIRAIFTSPDRYVYFFVPLSTILQCSSVAEVKNALTAAGRYSFELSSVASWETWRGCQNGSGLIRDGAYDYIFNTYKHSGGLQAFRRDNGNVLMPLNHYSSRLGYVLYYSTDARTLVCGHQRYISAGLHSTELDDDGTDAYISLFASRVRLSAGTSTSLTSMWMFRTVSNNGIPFVAKVPGGEGSTITSYPPDAIPINDDPSARIGFFYYGTTLAADGASYSASRFGGYGQRMTVPFTVDMGMPCPESRRYIVFSSSAAGDISWAECDARCGQYRKYYAYRSSDLTDVYEVTGLDVPGGYNVINFQGRAITGVTGVGRMALLDMQAADDDGYDAVGGGTVSGNIVYNYLNRTFTPYPFAREGIRAELSNISKTTKITLPETRTNLIRGLLASGTDFRGSRCILRRIFPDHADTTGSDIVLLDGYIQDWSYVPGKKGIAFTVSKTLIDVGAQFPKRLMNMGCSHVFKGARCKYLGETGRCLKTKAFCQFLNNQNQFGGFPWVAARQRRVMWR